MHHKPLRKGGMALLCLIFLSFFSTQLLAQPTIVTEEFITSTVNSVHTLTRLPGREMVVLATQYESSNNNATVGSSPSLTWTKRVDAHAANSGDSEIWTAVFTAGGNITVGSSFGSGDVSSVCYVITGAESSLGGASNSATGQSAPSVGITTTRANSIIIGGISDWNAVNGGSRTYTGSPTETGYEFTSGHFTSYNFYKSADTATSYTLGVSSPTGQSAGTVLFEIRVPAGGGGDTNPPSAFTLSATCTRARTVGLSWTEATDNVSVTGYDVYVGGVLNGS